MNTDKVYWTTRRCKRLMVSGMMVAVIAQIPNYKIWGWAVSAAYIMFHISVCIFIFRVSFKINQSMDAQLLKDVIQS